MFLGKFFKRVMFYGKWMREKSVLSVSNKFAKIIIFIEYPMATLPFQQMYFKTRLIFQSQWTKGFWIFLKTEMGS